MLVERSWPGRAVPVIVAGLFVFSGVLRAQTPAPAAPPAKAATASLPPARDIIDRHIKEIGGRAAVLAHKSTHATGTFSVPASGMSGSLDIYGAAGPNRVLQRVNLPGVGEIVSGFDGSHGWTISPLTGPMLQQGKELDQAKLDADFYSELRDPANYVSIKTVEKTSFEGRECYKISLVRRDGSEDFDFYDAQTGLKAGSIVTRESPMGTITTTSVEGGYKKFGNLLQPTQLTQRAMNVEQTITVTSVEYDSVDPHVFDLPAPIKALIK